MYLYLANFNLMIFLPIINDQLNTYLNISICLKNFVSRKNFLCFLTHFLKYFGDISEAPKKANFLR